MSDTTANQTSASEVIDRIITIFEKNGAEEYLGEPVTIGAHMLQTAYYNGLSAASRHSLSLQGGPMDDAECKAFEEIPGFERIVMVRRCDDQGKISGMDVPPFESYLPMMHRVAGIEAG